MEPVSNSNNILYLKNLFVSYLLLGITDTIHHLHAAAVLGLDAAWHGFYLGVVFVPMATALVLCVKYRKNRVCLWLFLLIALLAIVLLGFYHGGLHHLIKLLMSLRVEGGIGALLPWDNLHFWFYEITGVLEFCMSIASVVILAKFVALNREYIRHGRGA